MKTTLKRMTASAMVAASVAMSLTACGLIPGSKAAEAETSDESAIVEVVDNGVEQAAVSQGDDATASEGSASASSATTSGSGAVTALTNMISGGVVDTTDLFTDRDLEQSADLTDASYLTIESDREVTITEEGTYVLSGDATNATIVVNVDSEAKVQLVLDGLTITNDDYPAIYVVSADKVFVTTAAGSQNTLSVTGAFRADGETNTDAAIFSKDDLVLNGEGTLTVNSTDNGITCKDDLKVTGGTYVINATADALEANDSIRIADGSFTISTSKDALHAENDEDDSVGYVYICDGDFTIDAASDGIRGTTAVQIDGGTFTISAAEGIEGTYVQINGGTINISASDDGINATYKSTLYTPTLEINGGDITINMAAGDTDALDANGYLYIHGGTVDISAQSAFDFDMGGEMTGGTVYVNGEQISELTNSMMMGGGMMGGDMGGGMMGGGMMGGPGGGR